MKKMNQKVLDNRKTRFRRILRVLEQLFPVRKTMLVYHNPYELLISVILSAQCTDAQVNRVTPVLFQKYPDPESLAQGRLSDIEKLIFNTGFYKTKARRIRDCAVKLVSDFSGQVPRTTSDLIMLAGVGRKTANVVLGNAFGIREGIAVDTHVKRFAIKHNLTDHTDPNKIEDDLKQIIPQKYWTDAAYYMISYGREICPARKHDHDKCPCTKFAQ
jgi:endonuclease-3